ncbi:MAG TPA: SIR2 family protein [Pyrinomonadaceae bacterium]|nr:SIR2 family protein [Pyrinomonadaceae bacterium]
MILVFAGAGASKAVNPDQYPTTVEFFKRLPQHIRGDKLFRLAVEYLEAQNEEGCIIDIEQILWLITELRDFNGTVSNASTIPGWFITENRFAIIGGRAHFDAREFAAIAGNVTVKIDSLVSDINKVVYELYADQPTHDELAENWVLLLANLKTLNDDIEIVTTNYDVVIEEAIRLTKAPVIDGRSDGIRPILDLNAWDLKDLDLEDRIGRLTKLHGSIDWIRGNGRIHVGFPMFQGEHDKHAIIYPGFKGVPSDPLFQQLHEYFHIALTKADLVIFIGYAFRDQYINDILQRHLAPSAKILILNPVLPSVPFPMGRFNHLEQFFDRDGIRALFHQIEDTRKISTTAGSD